MYLIYIYIYIYIFLVFTLKSEREREQQILGIRTVAPQCRNAGLSGSGSSPCSQDESTERAHAPPEKVQSRKQNEIVRGSIN